MPDIVLSAEEFTAFSVPHALCLAGECQYCLGLGSIVVATDLRVQVEVTETAGEFELVMAPAGPASGQPAGELISAWRTALGKLAVDDPGRLDGLRISLEFGEAGRGCPPDVLLTSPALGVALACAVKAHREEEQTVGAERVAELAAALLHELPDADHLYPDRYYAESFICAAGGARYVEPSSEPLNVQLMVPPQSLLLAVRRWPQPHRNGGSWQKVLRGALQKLGPDVRRLARRGEADMAALFQMAPNALDDRETGVLYGLLRVREMIAVYLERLGRPLLDHDLLAELCDEESAVLEDYFEFPASPYADLRQAAIENGALGAKLTCAFGSQPALIIMAPERREMLKEVLEDEFEDCCFLSADMTTAGAGSPEPLGADDRFEGQ